MDFITATYTDVGIRKKTNQDSMLLQQAQTAEGPILLAAICDGMGGLAKGEVASAAVIRALAEWFTGWLPGHLAGMADDDVKKSWCDIVHSMNAKISQHAASNKVNMGTTLACLLLTGHKYYLLNVGDSRVYQIDTAMRQLTKDQTFVQREVDMGRMTAEEALRDPQRNVLLQCIGASSFIEPDFFTGEITPGAAYLLCSDGFRHTITEDEFYEGLRPDKLTAEPQMQQLLQYYTDLNKYRREDDNISSMLIRVL